MTNKDDKNKQAELARIAEADRLAKEKALAAASVTPPLENTINTESQNWLDATSGKSGPIDYSKLSSLNFDLYNRASQRQQGERLGTGLTQMGAQNTNPGLTALLRNQSDDQRQQDASGGFENAVRMKDAQVRGDILPYLQYGQNRTMGLAGMTSNASQASNNAWSSFRPAPSLWQNLLMAGIAGGSQNSVVLRNGRHGS